MRPFPFHLDDGTLLMVHPEAKGSDAGCSSTFQLYHGRRLNDLNNYSGLISFDPASQEFYYTPGNLSLSNDELLKLISILKTNIYKL